MLMELVGISVSHGWLSPQLCPNQPGVQAVEDKSNVWQESYVKGEGTEGCLARIEELKESLRYARGISEEMSLLDALTREISALRQLNEPRYH
jgi:hypothetical protein